MSFENLNTRLGFVALLVAAFLAFVAIPNWVFSPSNVQNIILSPTFWPYILSGFLALTGFLLLLMPAPPPPPEVLEAREPASKQAWLRLVGLAGIMVVTMLALPRLGMVWTCMLAFLATAFMYRTRFPKAAIICAVVIPLVLYAFFAHVAGVAIPQGDFVRLP